jgi:heme-degrading monooxygenase HmoA
MFILNVDLSVKPGSGPALERTFKTIFVPAISKQEGFAQAALLRPGIAGADYRLVLGFENQTMQQKWVATPLHQEVWPRMEGHCAKYAVQDYTMV